MKKLIIFDLDGTLLNTIADLAHSTNYALNKLGYPTHDVEKYNFMVGNGINKLFERALPEGEKTEENVLRVRKEFIPYYDIHNADDSRPYPGISALLSYLQSAGIQIAVASNKYQAATEKLVAHYFPEIHFTAVFGQREGVNVKPDPTIVFDIQGNIPDRHVLCILQQPCKFCGLIQDLLIRVDLNIGGQVLHLRQLCHGIFQMDFILSQVFVDNSVNVRLRTGNAQEFHFLNHVNYLRG